MGSFKHFIDKLFSTIFKIIIIGGLIIGAYVAWTGWGNASMTETQMKAFEKEHNVKLSEADKKAGFSGFKTIFGAIDSELMSSQIESETKTNINREQKADE